MWTNYPEPGRVEGTEKAKDQRFCSGSWRLSSYLFCTTSSWNPFTSQREICFTQIYLAYVNQILSALQNEHAVLGAQQQVEMFSSVFLWLCSPWLYVLPSFPSRFVSSGPQLLPNCLCFLSTHWMPFCHSVDFVSSHRSPGGVVSAPTWTVSFSSHLSKIPLRYWCQVPRTSVKSITNLGPSKSRSILV